MIHPLAELVVSGVHSHFRLPGEPPRSIVAFPAVAIPIVVPAVVALTTVTFRLVERGERP